MLRNPRIYITGASCAGVTTLGQTLAAKLDVRQLDVDDFYWVPTDPPFTTKRPPDERVRLIGAELGERGWVLTGSFDGWGDCLIANADLIAFVVTPTPVRMRRLMAREQLRYGSRIEPGGDMYAIHTAFADWASQYDQHRPGYSGRSRARHEAWLSNQTLPIVRLDGTTPPEAMARCAVAALTKIKKVAVTAPR
jgi:adenylate kinase family enzyme